MADKILVKRGLKANLPTLSVGEPAYCIDTKEFFVGTATGNVLINDLSQLTDKVDKVTGKGLSTNDYDDVEKAEVAKVKDKADKTYVDAELGKKATQSALDATNANVAANTSALAQKANQTDLNTTNSNVALKADKTYADGIQSQVNNLVLGAVGNGNNAEVVQARGNNSTLNDRITKNELITSQFIGYNFAAYDYSSGVITTNGTYYLKDTGAAATLSGNVKTVKVATQPYTHYQASGQIVGNIALATFYDANMTYLGFSTYSASSTVVKDVEVITPANCYFVIFQTRDYTVQDIVVKLGTAYSTLLKADTDKIGGIQTDVNNMKGVVSYTSYVLQTITKQDGFYTSSGSITTGVSDTKYAKIPCIPHDKFKVSANISGAVVLAAFFNASNVFLGYQYLGSEVNSGGPTVYTDKVIETPDNCYFVGFSTRNDSTSPLTVKKLTTFYHDLSNLNQNQQDITTVKNLMTYQGYALQTITKQDGFYTITGSVSGGVADTKYAKLSCVPHDKFEVSGSISGNVVLAVFFDANNVFLGYQYQGTAVSAGNVTVYTDQIIEAPDNCYFIGFSTRYDSINPLTVKKLGSLYYDLTNLNNIQSQQVTIDNLKFDVLQSLDNTTVNQKNMGFAFNTFDKGYISIVVDDANVDIDKITSIVTGEYGFPICFAVIPYKLNSAVKGGYLSGVTTVKGTLDYAVAHGGEVLSHDDLFITSDNVNDFNVMWNHFAGTKKALKDAGYDVNGIITSGGTGYLNQDVTCEKWTRKYYSYNDYYGISEPYYNPRLSMAKTSLSVYKSTIDSIVANKTFRGTHFHGLYEDGITTDGTGTYVNGFQEADLRAILDYIKTYVNAGTLAVVPYGYVYKTFGTTALDKRLKSLGV